ncbi:MAG: hypothetical protein K6L81_18115 [Agarilytica sp.]
MKTILLFLIVFSLGCASREFCEEGLCYDTTIEYREQGIFDVTVMRKSIGIHENMRKIMVKAIMKECRGNGFTIHEEDKLTENEPVILVSHGKNGGNTYFYSGVASCHSE